MSLIVRFTKTVVHEWTATAHTAKILFLGFRGDSIIKPTLLYSQLIRSLSVVLHIALFSLLLSIRRIFLVLFAY